jgi:hypothetical protein
MSNAQFASALPSDAPPEAARLSAAIGNEIGTVDNQWQVDDIEYVSVVFAVYGAEVTGLPANCFVLT